MSSALDAFRAQREAVEQVHARLHEVTELVHTLRAQIDLGMSPSLRISTREVNARELLRHADSRNTGGRGLGGELTSVVWEGVTVQLGAVTSPPIDVLLARESTGADADPHAAA